ncbi:nitroreductase family deazaflavin-dependent oxidoreductase [Rhodococcus opacus]|uniref:nitroreductase family deazaflavin-dependent oxidoreductase n=1 Tax=Rhodococcus opacus TaxID=37919 RepID=UPI0005C19728|nr:nitroreductase family deazaflavin-dependent oxidoreductase [Rhodococcus opacus]MDX5970037.1 nitroreductase family deazaflavin-dependent oxidoreductase [Rhodococcus opacus]
MKVTQRPDPPTGLRRAFFRAPIHLYRWHLGFLLGRRFLLLEHIGRKSGKPRRVVLEVVNHDAVDDGYVVAVGFGPKTDWYRNLRARPAVMIQVGRRRLPVDAEFLGPEAGAEFMAHYGGEHPKLGVRLAKVMGFEVDGSAADFRDAGREIRFVRLRPRR